MTRKQKIKKEAWAVAHRIVEKALSEGVFPFDCQEYEGHYLQENVLADDGNLTDFGEDMSDALADIENHLWWRAGALDHMYEDEGNEKA